MEVCCIDIGPGNIDLLEGFIGKLGRASETFRYYNKRPVNVISNHLTTLMLTEDKMPVAYGHLEFENDTMWLGICVLPEKEGKGFGQLMMQRLIEKAKDKNIEKIDLTVDRINLKAIRLYEKFDFYKVSEHDSYFRYRLSL